MIDQQWQSHISHHFVSFRFRDLVCWRACARSVCCECAHKQNANTTSFFSSYFFSALAIRNKNFFIALRHICFLLRHCIRISTRIIVYGVSNSVAAPYFPRIPLTTSEQTHKNTHSRWREHKIGCAVQVEAQAEMLLNCLLGLFQILIRMHRRIRFADRRRRLSINDLIGRVLIFLVRNLSLYSIEFHQFAVAWRKWTRINQKPIDIVPTIALKRLNNHSWLLMIIEYDRFAHVTPYRSSMYFLICIRHTIIGAFNCSTLNAAILPMAVSIIW